NRYLKGKERVQFLRRNVKYYSPFFLFMMSIMVVTGAWRLTDYKTAFGLRYFEEVSTVLIGKLVIFLVVYLLAAYQSFGLGLRITGQGDKAMEDEVDAQLVDRVVSRMRLIATINLVLMTLTAAVGLILSRIPYFKMGGLGH
ncbi:MAG: hypothetical protein KDK66_05715, partial [Deltaproteobacteria bacterium]|nr:hypothetical protein [Deltaproteobacteria bacterium]